MVTNTPGSFPDQCSALHVCLISAFTLDWQNCTGEKKPSAYVITTEGFFDQVLQRLKLLARTPDASISDSRYLTTECGQFAHDSLNGWSDNVADTRYGRNGLNRRFQSAHFVANK